MNQNITPDPNAAFESLLQRTTLDPPQLDRDALMFHAGRMSQSPQSVKPASTFAPRWSLITASWITTAAVTLFFLLKPTPVQTEIRIVERTVRAPLETSGPPTAPGHTEVNILSPRSANNSIREGGQLAGSDSSSRTQFQVWLDIEHAAPLRAGFLRGELFTTNEHNSEIALANAIAQPTREPPKTIIEWRKEILAGNIF